MQLNRLRVGCNCWCFLDFGVVEECAQELTSKKLRGTRYLGHETGYQPIRDQCGSAVFPDSVGSWLKYEGLLYTHPQYRWFCTP